MPKFSCFVVSKLWSQAYGRLMAGFLCIKMVSWSCEEIRCTLHITVLSISIQQSGLSWYSVSFTRLIVFNFWLIRFIITIWPRDLLEEDLWYVNAFLFFFLFASHFFVLQSGKLVTNQNWRCSHKFQSDDVYIAKNFEIPESWTQALNLSKPIPSSLSSLSQNHGLSLIW